MELGFKVCPNYFAYDINEPCCNLDGDTAMALYSSSSGYGMYEDFACSVTYKCVPSTYFSIDDDCRKFSDVSVHLSIWLAALKIILLLLGRGCPRKHSQGLSSSKDCLSSRAGAWSWMFWLRFRWPLGCE